MDVSKLLLHPARLRILQYIRLRETVPTPDLVAYLKDIPRATVYYHVKLLEENGIIEVTGEKRIRGSIEKTYALKGGSVFTPESGLTALSTAFFTELMQKMNAYFDREGQDCARDRVLFETGLFHLSDSEYDCLLSDIASLLKPYVGREPDLTLPLRKLSVISSPPVLPKKDAVNHEYENEEKSE